MAEKELEKKYRDPSGNEGTYLSLSESLRVFRELIKTVYRFHEEKDRLLCLDPVGIGIREADGDEKQIREEERAGGEICIAAGRLAAFLQPREVALRQKERIGKGSDYYFITAIFYTCLTGRRLTRLEMFVNRPPDIADVVLRNDLNEETAAGLRRILKRGLASDVRNRYASLEEMESDLWHLTNCLQDAEGAWTFRDK